MIVKLINITISVAPSLFSFHSLVRLHNSQLFRKSNTTFIINISPPKEKIHIIIIIRIIIICP